MSAPHARPWSIAGSGGLHNTPDGTEIILSAQDARATKNAIFAVNSSSGAMRTLVQNLRGNGYCWPTISPSGTRVAFSQFDYGSNYWGLNTVPARGGRASRLHDTIIPSFTEWSPSGADLAFYDFIDALSDVAVVQLNLQSRTPTVLAQIHTIAPEASSPRYSKDGAKILFPRFSFDESSGEIATVPSAGGAPTVVARSNMTYSANAIWLR